MPAMPRPPGKAKKIAYKILGKPANMKDKNMNKERFKQMALFKTYSQWSR